MQGADTVMHYTLLFAGPFCPAAIAVNFLLTLAIRERLPKSELSVYLGMNKS